MTTKADILRERLAEVKRKKIGEMRSKKSYFDRNKIEFFGKEGSALQPNPIQARILSAWLNPKLKTFAITGANRIGKTTILSIIAFATMFGRFPWDDTDLSFLFPHNKPRKVRYIGQDWQSHVKKVVIPTLWEWWPKDRPVKTAGNGIITDTDWIDEKTGSTLQIVSNMQDPGTHEGDHFDIIIADEPPKHDIWIANARGLVDRNGRALFGMTLLKEAWIHHDIIKRLDPDGKPDRTVFAVDADISVNVGYGIDQEGVDNFARNLSDEERAARIDGKPSYLSGLVAKNFDRHTHIKERFKIPTNWMVDIAIDIHPRKEQAILFQATSERNERYLCFEIWEHGDGDAVADAIIRIVSRYALRVNRVVIDPLAKADSNNASSTYEKIERKLARYDMFLETASKDKVSGIIELNNHLKGPNGEPSLWVFNDLVMTINHIEGWVYDKDTQKPAKVKDDFCENLYRLLLLDTQYEDPEEFDDPDADIERVQSHNATVSPISGY